MLTIILYEKPRGTSAFWYMSFHLIISSGIPSVQLVRACSINPLRFLFHQEFDNFVHLRTRVAINRVLAPSLITVKLLKLFSILYGYLLLVSDKKINVAALLVARTPRL